MSADEIICTSGPGTEVLMWSFLGPDKDLRRWVNGGSRPATPAQTLEFVRHDFRRRWGVEPRLGRVAQIVDAGTAWNGFSLDYGVGNLQEVLGLDTPIRDVPDDEWEEILARVRGHASSHHA